MGVTVRLHIAGLSLRETAGILEFLGIKRLHQAIWQGKMRVADSGRDPPAAQPSRVAADETAVQINGDQHRVYATVDVDTTLLLNIELVNH